MENRLGSYLVTIGEASKLSLGKDDLNSVYYLNALILDLQWCIESDGDNETT